MCSWLIRIRLTFSSRFHEGYGKERKFWKFRMRSSVFWLDVARIPKWVRSRYSIQLWQSADEECVCVRRRGGVEEREVWRWESGEVTTERVWTRERQLLVRAVREWGEEEGEVIQGRKNSTPTSTARISALWTTQKGFLFIEVSSSLVVSIWVPSDPSCFESVG